MLRFTFPCWRSTRCLLQCDSAPRRTCAFPLAPSSFRALSGEDAPRRQPGACFIRPASRGPASRQGGRVNFAIAPNALRLPAESPPRLPPTVPLRGVYVRTCVHTERGYHFSVHAAAAKTANHARADLPSQANADQTTRGAKEEIPQRSGSVNTWCAAED